MTARAATTKLGAAAVRYAEHGWHVFPLRPCMKEPLLPESLGGHGFKDATVNLEQVRAWWTETPDANIGLAPGRSGLVVVDVDGAAGRASAQQLGLDAVETLTCRTGRAEGGTHLYFRRPTLDAIGNAPLGERLDVRGDRGYVVIPPSVHPTGAVYRYADPRIPAAALPAAAIEVLRARQDEPAAQGASYTLPLVAGSADAIERRVAAYVRAVPGVGEGSRNATGFRLAAMLANDFALEEPVVLAWVSDWNTRNAPPLTPRELRLVVRSAVRHGRHARGQALSDQTRSVQCAHLARVGRPILARSASAQMTAIERARHTAAIV